MTPNSEKTYTVELNTVEIFAITEAIGEIVEQSRMLGNDPEEFLNMAKCYLKANPGKSDEVLNIVRNYTIINSKMLQYGNDLSKVIIKADAVAQTI